MPRQSLADTLIETWEQQGREGFLLSDPASAEIGQREAHDERTNVRFRFLWMPHREIRGDVAELERRGILNPNRDERKLFVDGRDPYGRHCFLCENNVKECHPMERLVPLELAGRSYFAGANFAWIEPNHYTVMAAEHRDQEYSRHTLEAMLELYLETKGRFRVLFNGPGAGATIPWHLHYQITTVAMPIEQLAPGREADYPTAVQRFLMSDDGLDRAHAAAQQWLDGDPHSRTVNILIAPAGDQPCLFIFPRDRRYATARGKGLLGGFEVAGDFVLSAERELATFENASAELAREILAQVSPPDWQGYAAA